MRLKIYIFTLVAALWMVFPVKAQTIKQIEVGQGMPYVDHVSLEEGSADMDLLVKFAFDEVENGLTVSLISYKKLFVFHDNVRYKKSKVCRKLKPAKLPYVIESDPEMGYKYMKPLRRAVDMSYVFHRWVEVEGMQPRPTDYKMVNDYIEQSFDVMPTKTEVKVRLRDVLVMEKNAKRDRYDLYFHKNMDTDYEITILRDPCFGLDEQVKAAHDRLELIKTSFLSFKKQFPPGGKVFSLEEKDIFLKMKALLQDQYAYNTTKSRCTMIQADVDEYNLYVDSISDLTCTYEAMITALDLSADEILQRSRRMDNNVNRWFLTDDEAEKKDLVRENEAIIDDFEQHLAGAQGISGEQKAAIAIFRKAEKYFKDACVKKKEEK